MDDSTLGGNCDDVINDLVMIEDEAGAAYLQTWKMPLFLDYH